jgi:hypothetical protein
VLLSNSVHVCVCRIYVLAQLLAALLACSIFGFVSGWGPLSPLTSVSQLNLGWGEAVKMWFTGTPPKRFQHSGKENITDVLGELEERQEALRELNLKDRLLQGGKGVMAGGSALASAIGLGPRDAGKSATVVGPDAASTAV